MPVFLCVVNKADTSLQIYHTFPRFSAWSLPPLPKSLELTPGTPGEGEPVQWKDGSSYSLSAPILAFTINLLYELVASFVNRSNLLKSWEKTETCEGNASEAYGPKNAAITRIPAPYAATESHHFSDRSALFLTAPLSYDAVALHLGPLREAVVSLDSVDEIRTTRACSLSTPDARDTIHLRIALWNVPPAPVVRGRCPAVRASKSRNTLARCGP